MDIYIYKGVKYGFSVITVVNHVCIDLLPTLFLTLNKGGPLIVCKRVKELQF